ncbi:MAG TPA: helix-turn-helix transcriptional regulator [bacterium]|nr:helix-turn-helix transcriptional regulator [bacterium]
MKKKGTIYLSLSEFGSAIGLSQLEKGLIHQKNRMIDYLKDARAARGLTQAELARKVGTLQPAIARMEAGQVGDVSFDFLVRVALALGITLEVSSQKKAA